MPDDNITHGGPTLEQLERARQELLRQVQIPTPGELLTFQTAFPRTWQRIVEEYTANEPAQFIDPAEDIFEDETPDDDEPEETPIRQAPPLQVRSRPTTQPNQTMPNGPEIILRGGQFIRRDTTEAVIGQQSDIIKSMMSNTEEGHAIHPPIGYATVETSGKCVDTKPGSFNCPVWAVKLAPNGTTQRFAMIAQIPYFPMKTHWGTAPADNVFSSAHNEKAVERGALASLNDRVKVPEYREGRKTKYEEHLLVPPDDTYIMITFDYNPDGRKFHKHHPAANRFPKFNLFSMWKKSPDAELTEPEKKVMQSALGVRQETPPNFIVYSPPYPNVNVDGRLCMGDRNLVDITGGETVDAFLSQHGTLAYVQAALQSFYASPAGSDWVVSATQCLCALNNNNEPLWPFYSSHIGGMTAGEPFMGTSLGFAYQRIISTINISQAIEAQ